MGNKIKTPFGEWEPGSSKEVRERSLVEKEKGLDGSGLRESATGRKGRLAEVFHSVDVKTPEEIEAEKKQKDDDGQFPFLREALQKLTDLEEQFKVDLSKQREGLTRLLVDLKESDEEERIFEAGPPKKSKAKNVKDRMRELRNQ